VVDLLHRPDRARSTTVPTGPVLIGDEVEGSRGGGMRDQQWARSRTLRWLQTPTFRPTRLGWRDVRVARSASPRN